MLVTIVFSIFFALYGIVIGSFVNVLILRLPIKESITLKRSHCMTCGHTLSWYELIPLFSYLFLGGKCRHCKAHFSTVPDCGGCKWNHICGCLPRKRNHIGNVPLLPVCFCLTSVKRHRLAYTGNPLGIQYFYTNFGTG